MTLVLDLPAEIESRLQAEATARGVSVEVVAIERLGQSRSATTNNREQEKARRMAALEAGQKALAHIPFDMDEFLAEKHAEIERDNAKWDRLGL
jgi:hypothetical protein